MRRSRGRSDSPSPAYNAWRQGRDFRDAVIVDGVSWFLLWAVLMYVGITYDWFVSALGFIALLVNGRANRVQIQIIQEDVQHWLDQLKAAADKED